MKRIGVFVDLSNLYYCCKSQFAGRKLDFAKYLDYAKSFGDITHAHAYGVKVDERSQSFVTILEKLGFTVHYRTPKRICNGATTVTKADWDVGIAVQVIDVILNSGLDLVVLGSADGDMAPLIQWLVMRQVQVMVLGCNVSHELRDIANITVEIPESMLEPKRRRGHRECSCKE